MQEHWTNDDELFDLMKRELFSAVIGDIMDQLGYQHQFLPPEIQPLKDTMVLVGRAMPVLEADIDQGIPEALADKPFGLMLEALDDLKHNEVYICTGSSPTYALWGELMSTRAMQLGAVGAVVDGYSRDTTGILALGFPTFSYGRYAQDQGPRGKVIDFRVPIEIGNVKVEQGDIIFGDLDGVCIVPRSIEIEVIAKSLEKARGEKTVKTAIENGMSACAAFEKYGIM
ncbi:RraA family protein [Fulvivirgaceae bacterium BMA10]|uniref:Putative 4-hydroxy-4-methyl-2-oxoglutarate aldolase n=1 Tax=Splendidivirga corallicola TaxID=3051826 RepID=A0ABT8KHU1_9BACT|nr:RraA family protein [Fulvivirgaceae bacterium BMA10]